MTTKRVIWGHESGRRKGKITEDIYHFMFFKKEKLSYGIKLFQLNLIYPIIIQLFLLVIDKGIH